MKLRAFFGGLLMNPQPATEMDTVVARLNDLIGRIAPPSPFELAQLERDICRLGNVDVVESQCLFGSYHALRGDLENTVKCFDKALALNPNSSRAYTNYASSLSRLGQHEQAIKMALEGISRNNSQESINILLLCAYYADDHAVIEKWLPKYEKLTGNPHDVAFWLQEDAEDEAYIKEHGDEIRKGPHAPWEQVKKELGL